MESSGLAGWGHAAEEEEPKFDEELAPENVAGVTGLKLQFAAWRLLLWPVFWNAFR